MFENLFSKTNTIKKSGGMFDGIFTNKNNVSNKEEPQFAWRNIPQVTDWRKEQPMSSISNEKAKQQKLKQLESETTKAKRKADWLNSPLGVASETFAAQNLIPAAGTVAKNIAQGMARGVAGAVISSQKEKSWQPETGIEKAVFGANEVKPLREQGAENIQGLAGLTKQKISDETAKKYGLLAGIVGLGLDWTPFGGGKQGAIKYLAKINKAEDALSALKKMGVADDLAQTYAPIVAKTTNPKAMEKLVGAIEKAQNTTKATGNLAKNDLMLSMAKNTQKEPITLYHGSNKSLSKDKLDYGTFFDYFKTGGD